MKRVVSSLLCGMLICGLMSGCGSKEVLSEIDASKDQTETESKQETKVAGNAEVQTVTIWHDADEAIMNTIADEVNTKLKDENVQVVFEKKTGLTDQLQLYGNDKENGPDMYFYAHDSLGTFAEMGILAPITDFISVSDEEEFLPMTVEAGTYGGTQFMLPVYYETLLFIYNKGLWEGDIPTTTDELYDYMKAHTNSDAGTYALVNQHSTAYNVAPFINGFGGCIITDDGKPGLNLQETKDAITYNQQFAALEGAGDYDTCNTLFNEQKAAAIIGGPWLISGIKEAGINYGIKSLADFKLPNGNGLAPYSGIQGVGILKYALETKKDAITSVLKALCDKETGIAIAKNSNCAPANEKSYEDTEVAANEMIMAMRTTAEIAKPMPNIPQMSVMWSPTESLLAAVNMSGEEVDSITEKYQKEAETAISDMQ